MKKEVDPKWIRTLADRRAIEEGCWFDQGAVDRCCAFVAEFCRLAQKPNIGKPVIFTPFIYERIVAPLIGWKRPDGTRRFRRGSCWCMRKVHKTTTLAALALWFLLEEPAAEVYILSSCERAARTMFRIAAGFIAMDEELQQIFEVKPSELVIQTIPTGDEDNKVPSRLEVLAGGETGASGQSASAVLVDEVSEIKNQEAYQRLYGSGAAREQPVWFEISTPQFQKNSLAGDCYQKSKDIIEGRDLDTEWLPVVQGVPAYDEDGNEVDWKNPDNWWPHIPTIASGHLKKEDVLKDWESCQGSPRKIARFRNHTLGMWCESACSWVDSGRYDCCVIKEPIEETTYHKRKAYGGYDWGAVELTCWGLWFTEEKLWLPRFFYPEDRAKESDAKRETRFCHWAEQGFIELTEGDEFDWLRVREQIIADCEKFDVVEIGYDPAGMQSRMSELAPELGIPCTPVPQIPSHMSEAMIEIEQMIRKGEISFPRNDCMRWNALSVAVKKDNQERLCVDRDNSGGRWDGMSALICAVARWLGTEQEESSIYDERGIFTW